MQEDTSVVSAQSIATIGRKSDSPWFVYLIENKLGHYYCGISLDVERRFAEHQSGGAKAAKALRGKSPLKLVYCVKLANQTSALSAERWIKKQSRKTKLAILAGSTKLPFAHETVTL